MPKYLVERQIPGASHWTREQLSAAARKSVGVLRDLGPDIQWIESYVTEDKVYCVDIAPSEDLIREHARKGGFPANRIAEISGMLDPTAAEG